MAIATSGAVGHFPEESDYLAWLELNEKLIAEQLAENIVSSPILSSLMVWALDEDDQYRGMDKVNFNKANARTAFLQAVLSEAKEAARQVKEVHP